MSMLLAPAIMYVGASFVCAYIAFNLNEDWIPLKIIFLSFSYLSIVGGFGYCISLFQNLNVNANVIKTLTAIYKGSLWVLYLFLFFLLIYFLVWVVGLVNNYVQKKKDEKFGL